MENGGDILKKKEPVWGDPARTLSDLKNPTFTSFLDLARWTCAWLVFLGHLRNPTFLGYESLAAADRTLFVKAWYFVTGWYGEAVIVFFVLSGYLVGGVACAKVSVGRFAPRDYAIDRVSRIYLPFVPTLLLTVLLDEAGAAFFGDVGFYTDAHPMIHEKIATDPFASNLTLNNFVANSLMLQTILVPPLGSNRPLWTVSLEFWFYVVFGLVLASCLSGGAVRRWSGLAATTVLAWTLGQGFLVHAGLWLIGVGAAFVSAPKLERPLLAFLSILCLLTLLRLAGSGFVHGDLINIAVKYLVAFSFAWLLLAMRRVRLGSLERAHRFNTFMASFSYSLYLIHFPLMLFILGALHATGRFDGIAHGYSPTDGRGLTAYAVTAGAVGVCAFAFALLTESQTPRLRLFLKRRFGQQGQSTAASGSFIERKRAEQQDAPN